jgi:hypothetical protein
MHTVMVVCEGDTIFDQCIERIERQEEVLLIFVTDALGLTESMFVFTVDNATTFMYDWREKQNLYVRKYVFSED